MVSIRRRKLVGHGTGRRSTHAVLQSVPNRDVSETPDQNRKSVNVRHTPSVSVSQSLEDKEENDTVGIHTAKKQKTHVQVDPENPIEVHSYLLQLKEDNKLDLGPKQRSEEIPVKEWMEDHYPHIFRVFPQDPKVISESSDGSKENEVLYYQYCLFLFVLRNIVLIDCNVSSDHVESLGSVIKNLEKQGFDCKFLRSELLVVGNMMKQQLEITLAMKNVISTRIKKLEKELLAVERKQGKVVEPGEIGKMEGIRRESEALPRHLNGLGNPQKEELSTLEQEFIRVTLKSHKKVLEYKEEEAIRLGRVLEKISQMYGGKPVFF